MLVDVNYKRIDAIGFGGCGPYGMLLRGNQMIRLYLRKDTMNKGLFFSIILSASLFFAAKGEQTNFVVDPDNLIAIAIEGVDTATLIDGLCSEVHTIQQLEGYAALAQHKVTSLQSNLKRAQMVRWVTAALCVPTVWGLYRIGSFCGREVGAELGRSLVSEKGAGKFTMLIIKKSSKDAKHKDISSTLIKAEGVEDLLGDLGAGVGDLFGGTVGVLGGIDIATVLLGYTVKRVIDLKNTADKARINLKILEARLAEQRKN